MIEFKTLKKLLRLLLTCLLLYNSFGYFIVHIYRVTEVKSDVLKSIKEHSYEQNLTVLVFSKDELTAGTSGIDRIDEKEFRYNGGMYDIVKEEIKDDSVYFYCIFDEKESLLDFIFTEHFEKNQEENSSDKMPSSFVFKFLSDYNSLKDWIVPPEKFRLMYFLNRSDNLFLNYFPNIPTPPPQIHIFT